jgi:hypothetical protein
MTTTRVMAFTDAGKAGTMAADFVASGYKVIRIDKPDVIELMKPGNISQYWHSDDEGPGVDYILLIATKDMISVS